MQGMMNNGLVRRTSKLGSWALGAAAFLTIGWMAMAPSDPLGAVSVLARSNSLLMLAHAGVLAGVVAALGTLLAGWIRPDAGTFAAALGLAAVSLRGGTATRLLVEYAESYHRYAGVLAAKFALEALGWTAVVAVALFTSAVVARWCFAVPTHRPGQSNSGRSPVNPPLAALDVPGAGRLLTGTAAYTSTPLRTGLLHTALVGGVGLMTLILISEESTARAVRHGQACFVVAVAVVVGCYVAHRFAPVRSSLWAILAVPLMALAGYLWAVARPAAQGLPPSIPTSRFLCILPIQFISVGTAAALAMFWRESDLRARFALAHDSTGRRASTEDSC